MAKKKEDIVEGEVVGETKSDYSEYTGYIHHHRRGGVFWGLVLVAFGGALIAQSFVDVNVWQYFWPALLVVLGLSLVIRSLR